jgi:hypothetical protein
LQNTGKQKPFEIEPDHRVTLTTRRRNAIVPPPEEATPRRFYYRDRSILLIAKLPSGRFLQAMMPS